MIDEKKITEAVNAYIGFPKELGEGLETSMRRDAFRDGVDWFKNALWHDASEEPTRDEKIIVQYEDWGGDIDYDLDIHYPIYSWKHKVEEINVTKWCYLADLLPKGGDK